MQKPSAGNEKQLRQHYKVMSTLLHNAYSFTCSKHFSITSSQLLCCCVVSVNFTLRIELYVLWHLRGRVLGFLETSKLSAVAHS